MIRTVVLFCRSGFENECAAEVMEHANALGVHGYPRAKPETGMVIFEAPQTDLRAQWFTRIALHDLIFARQWFGSVALLHDLPVGDRVAPMAAALAADAEHFGGVVIETADTNLGKELSPLCRALQKPLETRLRQEGMWRDGAPQCVHVCLLSTSSAYVGFISARNSSPWPGGVPRLKFPRGAPSRSTLKLDEAFSAFLSPEQQREWLQPEMTAVDLGAAPGGWTYQFVRRHMRVTAVDNAAIDATLLDSGIVEHRREDGFNYCPPKRVDWMVCDMVEQPIRIARLAARWLAEGWCRRTIFNLKLPMKKRFDETQRCLAEIASTLEAAGVSYEIACKQLYHDREEVTVYAARIA